MALSTPSGYTSSDLVFQEDFSGTTLGGTWHNYITSNAAKGAPWNSNGSGGNGRAESTTPTIICRARVEVNNGIAEISRQFNRRCAANNQGVAQTFPITSGAVSSYGNFEFTGGYLSDQHESAERRWRLAGAVAAPGKGGATAAIISRSIFRKVDIPRPDRRTGRSSFIFTRRTVRSTRHRYRRRSHRRLSHTMPFNWVAGQVDHLVFRRQADGAGSPARRCRFRTSRCNDFGSSGCQF